MPPFLSNLYRSLCNCNQRTRYTYVPIYANCDCRKPQWTRTHSRYMRMGGFRLRCRGPLSRHEASPCDCEEIALDEDCILFAIACGLLPQEPPVTSQEISDQSKTSLFAKVIAIWQIVYFIADLVTRLVRRLPVSQLEVGVAAFGMLAIATLCAYFDKPKGVSIGTRVSFQLSSSLEVQEQEGAQENPKKTQENPKETQENPKETLENLKKTLEYLKGQKKEIYFKSLKDALAKRGNSFESRSRSFHRELASQIFLESDIDDMQGAFWMAATAAGIFALPFGAVHVAAWNASFPTVADLWLWRISSLISMVILLSSAGIMVLATTLCKEKFPDPVINVLVTVIYSFAALYTLARVILIVEMVRCMLFLPPEAFVTTWTANIPHLG